MIDDLEIRPGLVIPGEDLLFTAVRASGPGGQNVNKLATKVELHFDLEGSTALSASEKERVRRAKGVRFGADGRLVVESQLTRSQRRNLEDARSKLAALLRAALVVPKRRRPTQPSRGAKRRRVDAKVRHGEKKRARRSTYDD